MAYREQAYVERSAERCFCDAAMARRCRCCRRPRCAEHVARGLCNRCDQAIARRRDGIATRAWLFSGVVGVALTVAMIAVGMPAGILGAVALAAAVRVGSERALLARTIKQLRPGLATTVGELPAPATDHGEFPPPSTTGVDPNIAL